MRLENLIYLRLTRVKCIISDTIIGEVQGDAIKVFNWDGDDDLLEKL